MALQERGNGIRYDVAEVRGSMLIELSFQSSPVREGPCEF